MTDKAKLILLASKMVEIFAPPLFRSTATNMALQRISELSEAQSADLVRIIEGIIHGSPVILK